MKLFLYGRTMAVCDLTCAILHRIERHAMSLREWAWHKATVENLRQCNIRAVRRRVY